MDRWFLTELMDRAIRERRFQVWYQPVYHCRTGGFCAGEALLRLWDDGGEPVPPDVFIPLAEETGMIVSITWLVLERVCELLGSGKVPGLRQASVNFSMRQLADPGWKDHLQRLLQQYGVSPEQLKLEITENFLPRDIRSAAEQLRILRNMGLELWMDDFGTGCSNLANMLNFPFETVKLDRSLICRAAEDQAAVQMVRGLIAMLHSMGKQVVAEGAETGKQAEALRRWGADMIQGYCFARPQPQERLSEYFCACPPRTARLWKSRQLSGAVDGAGINRSSGMASR